MGVVVLDGTLIRDLVIAFGWMLSAGLGNPLAQEEASVAGAGVWAAHSPEHGFWRWLMLPVCIAGVVSADLLLYFIGRHFGVQLLRHSWTARLIPDDKRRRIESNFHRYGIAILIFGRILPGIRTPLFLTSGLMRLPVRRFLLADALGAVVGNSLFFLLGFWLGDQFHVVLGQARRDVVDVQPLLIVLALGAVAVFFLVRFLRRPVPTGDPEELPIIGPQVAAHIEGTQKQSPSSNGSTHNGETGSPVLTSVPIHPDGAE